MKKESTEYRAEAHFQTKGPTLEERLRAILASWREEEST